MPTPIVTQVGQTDRPKPGSRMSCLRFRRTKNTSSRTKGSAASSVSEAVRVALDLLIGVVSAGSTAGLPDLGTKLMQGSIYLRSERAMINLLDLAGRTTWSAGPPDRMSRDTIDARITSHNDLWRIQLSAARNLNLTPSSSFLSSLGLTLQTICIS